MKYHKPCLYSGDSSGCEVRTISFYLEVNALILRHEDTVDSSLRVRPGWNGYDNIARLQPCRRDVCTCNWRDGNDASSCNQL